MNREDRLIKTIVLLVFWGFVVSFTGSMVWAIFFAQKGPSKDDLLLLKIQCADLPDGEGPISPGNLLIWEGDFRRTDLLDPDITVITSATATADTILCIEHFWNNDNPRLETNISCGPYTALPGSGASESMTKFSFRGQQVLLVDIESETVIARGEVLWPAQKDTFRCPGSFDLFSVDSIIDGSPTDETIATSINNLYR